MNYISSFCLSNLTAIIIERNIFQFSRIICFFGGQPSCLHLGDFPFPQLVPDQGRWSPDMSAPHALAEGRLRENVLTPTQTR